MKLNLSSYFFFCLILWAAFACKIEPANIDGITKALTKDINIHQEPVNALARRYTTNSLFDLTYLSNDQNLYSPYIHTIAKDNKGYLWFATEAGVCRYDGLTFELFSRNDGLGASVVYVAYIDSKSNWWFGTNNGFTKYDGKKILNYSTTGTTIDQRITSIIEDKQGRMWLGSTTGAFCFDGQKFISFPFLKSLKDIFVKVVYEDNNSNIWFGTENGLKKLNGNVIDEIISEVEVQSIKCINNKLYVGTKQGLFCLEGDKIIRFTTENGLPHNFINDIIEDNKGNIWLATRGGVSRFDGQRFKNFTKHNGLAKNHVKSICEDNQGNLWFATAGGGVFRYNPNSFRFFDLTKDLEEKNPQVWGIEEDNNRDLLIATNRSGVLRYQNGKFKQTFVDTIKSGTFSLLKDSKNNLWFGTTKGVGIIGKDKYQVLTKAQGMPTNLALKILEDHTGKFWFGTTKGISCFRDQTKYKLPLNQIKNVYTTALLEDEQKKIWIGNANGLFYYKGRRFSNQTSRHVFFENGISTLFEDSQKNLWIASYDGLVLKKGNSFKNVFGLGHHMRNVAFRSIDEDKKGNIWLGSKKGISMLRLVPQKEIKQFDKLVLGKYQLFEFSKLDGLRQVNVFLNSHKLDSRNRLWWGGNVGVTMLDLNKFEIPSKAPRIPQLNHIKVNEKYIDYRQLKKDSVYQTSFVFGQELTNSYQKVTDWYNYPTKLQLPYYLNHLTFHFSAIDWAAPHKLRFRYRVKGLDRQWSTPSPNNFADYRNIPFGKYTLEIQATGVAQKWSKVFRYQFEVLPPWWRTWWAYTLYGLTILLTGWAILRWRTARLRKNQLILEETVKQKTEEISAQNEEITIQRDQLDESLKKLKELDSFKEQTVNMIAHDLKTPLNNIIGLSEGEEEGTKQYRIFQSSKQMLHMIINMLETQKLEEAEMQLKLADQRVDALVSNAIEQVFWMARSKNVRLLKKTKEVAVVADANLIERVLVNLLNNAIKYSPNNSDVLVQAERIDDKFAKFSVTDTGAGISEEAQTRIFDKFYQAQAKKQGKHSRSTGLGLTFCKLAVELQKGEIGVTSSVNLGSTFWFTLPLASEQAELPQNQVVINNEGLLVDLEESTLNPESTYPIFAFNEKESQLLEPWLTELKKYEVYQLSKIKAILAEMNFEVGSKLAQWKKELEQALYGSNEEQYQTLIHII